MGGQRGPHEGMQIGSCRKDGDRPAPLCQALNPDQSVNPHTTLPGRGPYHEGTATGETESHSG